MGKLSSSRTKTNPSQWSQVTKPDGSDFASLAEAFGMIWILAHWLAPVTATREDVESFISKASERWQEGRDIGNGETTPW